MEGQSCAKVARLMLQEDDDEMDEQERRLEDSLQQVLSNQLVCENIASFLSLSDMKAASEVTRQFLHAIRGTRRFAQTAVLEITDRNLEDIQSIVRTTDYAWRGVKVDVTDPTYILEDLRRVLQSAEFVVLEGRPWVIEDCAVKDATAVSFLTTVLSSSPNLSELKIDIRFLSWNVEGVFSSPAVQQTLRNLNSLDVERMTELENYWESFVRYLNLNSEDEDTWWRNFGLLTGLPNRLKYFKLTKLTPNENRSIESPHRSVLQLLRNNRATLEELRLGWSIWRIKEVQTLTFPALKALTASVQNLCDGDTLGEFLKNQRSLEELTLTSWLGPAGDPLYTKIKECSVRLKKLHLSALTVEQLDWSFLALMNRLTDFRLKMRGGLEIADNVLASLPKNQLESLSLEGIWNTWGGPSGFSSSGRVEDEIGYKTEQLEGFRCLRKLSFVGSWDAVDDELMQWLLKEFVTLEEFQLSDCTELTDAGISGKTTAEWGRDASFADLRRLKTLKIVKCHRVTPNGILESCVNVPWLKSLEYSNPPGPIEESVVMELVGQIPRLERLTLDYRIDVDSFGKLKAMLMNKNPRVKFSLAEKEDG